jgi:hypothetical protein
MATKNDIRGSGRYSDASHVIEIINCPKQHSDLMTTFPGYEDYLERLFIINFIKNRNNIEAKINFWASNEYSLFTEI